VSAAIIPPFLTLGCITNTHAGGVLAHFQRRRLRGSSRERPALDLWSDSMNCSRKLNSGALKTALVKNSGSRQLL
jgi:hypothetical protein